MVVGADHRLVVADERRARQVQRADHQNLIVDDEELVVHEVRRARVPVLEDDRDSLAEQVIDAAILAGLLHLAD